MKRVYVKATWREMQDKPLGIDLIYSSNVNLREMITGARTWVLALCFAGGSRSNPIVRPLASVWRWGWQR